MIAPDLPPYLRRFWPEAVTLFSHVTLFPAGMDQIIERHTKNEELVVQRKMFVMLMRILHCFICWGERISQVLVMPSISEQRRSSTAFSTLSSSLRGNSLAWPSPVSQRESTLPAFYKIHKKKTNSSSSSWNDTRNVWSPLSTVDGREPNVGCAGFRTVNVITGHVKVRKKFTWGYKCVWLNGLSVNLTFPGGGESESAETSAIVNEYMLW